MNQVTEVSQSFPDRYPSGEDNNIEDFSNDSDLSPALIRNVCFYSPPTDGSEPKYITLDMEKDGKRNYPHHQTEVRIRDIRGREHDFCLNIHGFEAVTNIGFGNIDVSNERELEAVYVPQVKNLLLRHMGASKVMIFDTTIRRAAKSELLNRPVRKIHIDQSARGAHLRAKHSLSREDTKKIEAGELRFRIVNVWKPMSSTVLDHPIMFADSTSVREEDLVAVEQRYPHYEGETYAVRYNPAARFWFWSGMSASDLLLLQCYDSLEQVDSQGSKRRTRCAHSSFNLSGSEEEPFTRSSIELRCLVLG